MEEYLLLIILGALLVIAALALSFYLIHNKRVERVRSSSELVKQLVALNECTRFHHINFWHNTSCAFDAKRKFDSTTPDDYFKSQIQSNLAYYKNIISNITENRNKNTQYLKSYDLLKSSATEKQAKENKLKFNKYIKLEKHLYSKLKLSPVLDCAFSCKLTYTSPAGRNHYRKENTYSFNLMSTYCHQIEQLLEKKQSREYQMKLERSKATPALRFEILKRDNHTCRSCGASSKDGAKLHVDHIIPVAKGGKTELSNLQTLCDTCNLGKSDKH